MSDADAGFDFEDDSLSTPGVDREVDEGEPLVRVEGLKKYFSDTDSLFGNVTVDDEFPYLRREDRQVKAVDDVSFDIKKGETLGLVGESGCGKSTLARTVLRLLKPTDGSVYFKGEDLATLSGEPLRTRRKEMQMIFQDPQSSLDPRMKVGPIVEEPMKAHGMLDEEGREARARELLEKVGLDPQHYNRYPHAFSGGQRQRVNLARALSVNPDFIVCDEPVSALDVSIQAQVLNTMEQLQEEFDLTYLFIAHDLSVIRYISDRVAVMYLGKLVELADKEELYENPQHPYTKALLDSIPVPDPRSEGKRGVLKGDVPSPLDPPSGCRFRTRCPKLIQPDGFDMSDGEWEDVREFTRAVDRRTFDVTDGSRIREEYFEDGVPDGDAGGIVEEAFQHLSAEEWVEAGTLLIDSFAEQSICAREEPAYEVETEYGTSRHYAACHLHQEDGTDVSDEVLGGSAEEDTGVGILGSDD
ncbi:ABC-type oligopeptide transport system, ATPase component [Halalkaliarchaeum sp. AArc-CO]|uniref:ABC transporter ATP-binding protein n=1 Tax=unclassified Halalkaliarchaeum TaxID=2678344 RepID=UPI00217D18AF|nr:MULTISPECIES: ABC transporter ATP-binding protein [unclassified Halalkaliarchaeum]MDR5672861.1 ABC transporter ATP-binding protein [Halalkaliarchaeum sp. AArc-GB]UWG50209.1 ABC-type oligopeptide transport system, ATPase component [Halalkaliarchaeum sp. AArc-CO]